MKRTSCVRILAAVLLAALFIFCPFIRNEANAASTCTTGSKKGIQSGNASELMSYDGSTAFFNLNVSSLIYNEKDYKALSEWQQSYFEAVYKYNNVQYYLYMGQLQNLQSSCIQLRNANCQSITVGLLVYQPVPGITIGSKAEGANMYALISDKSANKTCVKAVIDKIASVLGEYVDYWQLGNEIDNFYAWNRYAVSAAQPNQDSYIKNYCTTLRLVNDAMKKYKSDCAAMIPFDQGWQHVDAHHFTTTVMLPKIASVIKEGGDFNWGLALHPYPNPLNSANFWNDNNTAGVTKTNATTIVTFYNLEVITNYMNNTSMKFNNAVRPIIVTEWGCNAYAGGTENQNLQAASFAYAYYKTAGNPYIKSVVYNAIDDNWDPNYNFGLRGSRYNESTSRKIENVFRHIDQPDGYKYTKSCLTYLGKTNWEELLTLTELGVGSSFTGTLTVGDHAVYYTKGAVDTSKNGLYTSKSDGRVFYLTSGRSSVDYSTVVKDSSGKMYYISHGMKDPNFTGMEKCTADGKFYFLENGEGSTYTGIVYRPSTGVWHYVKNGVYDSSFTGFAPKYDGGTGYVKSGKFQSDANGIITVSGTKYIVENGLVDEYYTGLKKDSDSKWYFFVYGVQNKDYTGLVIRPDTGDWYYVKNGVYDNTFTGFAPRYNYTTSPNYYVKKGKYQADYEGYAKDPENGKWYYVSYGYRYYEVYAVDDLESYGVAWVEGMTETVTEDGVTWQKYPETGHIYVRTIMGEWQGDLATVNANLSKKLGDEYLITVNSSQSPDDPWGPGRYYVSLRAGNRSSYHYVTIIPASEASDRLYMNVDSTSVAATKTAVLEMYDDYYSVPVSGFTWTSSDETIATVDQKGVVKGIAAGHCVVTASYAPLGLSYSCDVTVLFKDVANSDKYYYEPVYWAFNRGITTGTSPTTFEPNKNCTRAQFVTFLWRLAGQPEPAEDAGFTDVKEGAFYEKAVNWAAENNITTGLNDGTGRFGVNNDCTRAQCITFLWRAAGQPTNGIEDAEDFVDVKEGAFYETAVKWGSANGITTGLNDGSGKFGVCIPCTRGMVVTFLKRYDDYCHYVPEDPEEP